MNSSTRFGLPLSSKDFSNHNRNNDNGVATLTKRSAIANVRAVKMFRSRQYNSRTLRYYFSDKIDQSRLGFARPQRYDLTKVNSLWKLAGGSSTACLPSNEAKLLLKHKQLLEDKIRVAQDAITNFTDNLDTLVQSLDEIQDSEVAQIEGFLHQHNFTKEHLRSQLKNHLHDSFKSVEESKHSLIMICRDVWSHLQKEHVDNDSSTTTSTSPASAIPQNIGKIRSPSPKPAMNSLDQEPRSHLGFLWVDYLLEEYFSTVLGFPLFAQSPSRRMFSDFLSGNVKTSPKSYIDDSHPNKSNDTNHVPLSSSGHTDTPYASQISNTIPIEPEPINDSFSLQIEILQKNVESSEIASKNQISHSPSSSMDSASFSQWIEREESVSKTPPTHSLDDTDDSAPSSEFFPKDPTNHDRWVKGSSPMTTQSLDDTDDSAPSSEFFPTDTDNLEAKPTSSLETQFSKRLVDHLEQVDRSTGSVSPDSSLVHDNTSILGISPSEIQQIKSEVILEDMGDSSLLPSTLETTKAISPDGQSSSSIRNKSYTPELNPEIRDYLPVTLSSVIRWVTVWYSVPLGETPSPDTMYSDDSDDSLSDDSDDDSSVYRNNSSPNSMFTPGAGYVPKGAAPKNFLTAPRNLNINPDKPAAYYAAILFGARISPDLISENMKSWFRSYGGSYNSYIGTETVNVWA